MKRIVFIEGVSGVGKTQTVRKLGDGLRAFGFEAKCHFEGEQGGPLDLFPRHWRARLRARGPFPGKANGAAAFAEVFADMWLQFAAAGGGDCDFEIFDATLSHMANDLLRSFDASADEIVKHLETLLQIVRPFDPHIVYLSTENVSERLAKARVSRGEPPYDRKKFAFWEKRKRVDLSVLPRLSPPAQTINIENDDWGGVAAEIIARIAQ